MNKSHIKIIAWEQTRHVFRLVLACTVAFALVNLAYQVLDYMYFHMTPEEQSNYPVHIAQDAQTGAITRLGSDYLLPVVYFGALVNILILLLSNSSGANLQFHVSQYYLRLPVNPWLLVATRIVVNCAILIISTSFLLWIHYRIVIPDETVPPAAVLVSIIAFYLPIQFVAFSFSNRPAIFGLSIIFIAPLLDTINGNQTMITFFANSDYNAPTYSVVLLSMAIATILLSGFALRYQRFNESLPVFAVFGSISESFVNFIKNRNNRELPRFQSPLHAQAWLENRYMMNLFQGIFLLLFCAGLPVVLWGMTLLRTLQDTTSLLVDILHMTFGLMIFVATVSGIINGIVNYRRQTTTSNAFTYTKPITTHSLSHVRLLSVFRSTFIPLMIIQFLFIALFVAVLMDENYSGYRNIGSDSKLLLLFVLYAMFSGTIVATWAIRWALTTLPLTLYLAYIIAMALLIIDRYPIADWIIYLAMFIGFVPPIVLWMRAVVKFGISPQILLAFPGAFAVVYILLLAVRGQSFEIDEELLAQALCITIAAYMPFAVVPTAIDLTRHR